MQQIQLPPLSDGEIYIGAIGNEIGDFHHVILLPGDNDDAGWQEQMAWAKSIGGDLPTRAEQAMLWANFRDQLHKDFYWSNEVHHQISDRAWCRDFRWGGQRNAEHFWELRARAVRRISLMENP